jgi:DNA-binding transcriptional ArsR family regulator
MGYIQFMKKLFSALAEPNRLDIIELLRERQLTVGEIADRLELRQPQVSKHLRVLRDVELVEIYPDANRRIYKLRGEPFKELDSWLNSYRVIWDERFERLDDYLQDLQRKDVDHYDKEE